MTAGDRLGKAARSCDLASAMTGWLAARMEAEGRALREFIRDGPDCFTKATARRLALPSLRLSPKLPLIGAMREPLDVPAP